MAFQRRMSYMPGQPIVRDTRCPLSRDVGKIEGLKGIGVHSKRVPAFVLPDRCLQARGPDPVVERGFLQGGAADTQSEMTPDMMIVEMTAGEQQRYLHHDDNSGPRLTPVMPNGNPRSIKIVEGGYCPDTR
ncbi:hypothetical protein WJX79_000434 [Trebouxia sp. C0005]